MNQYNWEIKEKHYVKPKSYPKVHASWFLMKKVADPFIAKYEVETVKKFRSFKSTKERALDFSREIKSALN